MAGTTVDMELSEAEKILMNIIKQTDESKKMKMSQSCFWIPFLWVNLVAW